MSSDNDDVTPAAARTGRVRWVGLAVLATGLALIIIDGTIVGVALPRIITDLDLDLRNGQWVTSLYSVVFAALLLGTGRLGDRVGRRKLFVAGIVVFVVGSVMAAAAAGAASLSWARVVQGLGGACILPGTLSTVNATFRGRDRAVAFGVWGAVMSGAAAIGPLLGGWLTASFSWRWIFLVNVPIGALVLLGAVLTVPETRGGPVGRGVDVDGLQLSVIGLGSLVFAIIEGSRLGWWSPSTDFTVLGFTWPETWPISVVPVLAAIGLISLALFVRWERHRARIGRSALLDLGLFRLPTFSWGNVTAATVAIGEFALIFVLPLYLVNALALGTLHTGFVLAAMALGAFFSGASARHLAARFGAPMVVVIGLVLEIVGVGAVTFVTSSAVSPWLLAGLLVIYGLGLGLASAQLTSTVLRDVPTEVSGQGSATQSMVRQVGMALGTAVSGAALSLGLSHTLRQRLAHVTSLPDERAHHVAAATRESAGSTIGALRDQGAGGGPGDSTTDVVAALARGFSEATRWSLLTGMFFLLLGLIGAVRVLLVARE